MTTKYTARFDHIITAKDIIKTDCLNISEASQNELKEFVPFVDYTKSSDLLGLAFDVALVNVFNNNGDGICSMGALKMKETLYHKPINIEHNRDVIIGHILNGTFTDRYFKKQLFEEDVKNTNLPFNITLGGVLYKIVAKELGSVLLDIQNGIQNDFTIASSWEVGFDSYNLAVGSKILSECSIINDQKEVEGMSKYLKSFGGKGLTPDGLPINRLIDPNGTIVFLGAGLTKYPAADVGPVYAFDYSEDMNYDDEDEIKANLSKNISHFKNNNVIDLRSEINMNKEEIVKLIEEAVASTVDSKVFNQEAMASTTAKIADAIIESNKLFIAEKEQAEAKAKEVEAKASEQEAKIVSLEEKINETSNALIEATEKINKFEEEAKEVIAKEKFNERMSVIDDKFELTDADKEIIAKQISGLTSDEEFNDLEKNLEILMNSKLKSKIQEVQATQKEKIKEALAEELKKRGIVDPMESKAEETIKEGDIPNNSAQASEKEISVKEKFLKAFNKNNIKVTI